MVESAVSDNISVLRKPGGKDDLTGVPWKDVCERKIIKIIGDAKAEWMIKSAEENEIPERRRNQAIRI